MWYKNLSVRLVMRLNYDDLIIIIRAAGERTEMLCKKLIMDQGVTENKIHLIREVPFSAALKKSYEIGIDSGCKWIMCVDADLLLRPGSILEMIKQAEKQPKNVCEIQGFMLDKFFGGIRKGGVHLYRSDTLPLILKQIPDEGEDMRPETQTLRNMRKLGFKRAAVPYVVGLHDEKQFNKDIYRKIFVHGVKHMDRLPLFITIWKEQLHQDPDFAVALSALSESIKTTTQLYINSKLDIYTEMFEKSGFDEKDHINIENYTLDWVENKIQNWKTSDIYLSYFPNRDGYDPYLKGYIKKVKRLNKRFGPLYLIKTGWKKILK